MQTELTLLCHAATHAMKSGIFPTGDDGIVADHGDRWETQGRRIVTSPARAARETAARFTADASVDEAFGDLDYGRWHGRSIREIHDEDALGLGAWLSDPESAPHAGESIGAMAARVMDGLNRYAQEESCVIVTHAIVVKAALARVLDAPLTSIYVMDLEPLSTIVITWDSARWRLRVRTSGGSVI